jgi:hypothetical protein
MQPGIFSGRGGRGGGGGGGDTIRNFVANLFRPFGKNLNHSYLRFLKRSCI